MKNNGETQWKDMRKQYNYQLYRLFLSAGVTLRISLLQVEIKGEEQAYLVPPGKNNGMRKRCAAEGRMASDSKNYLLIKASFPPR